MNQQNAILRAAQAIADADTLLITAGAGMGVDSGLPDFRGKQGFWRAHPSYAAEGLTFQDLANPQWFFNEPRRAWGFYGSRYHSYGNTQPHAGFTLLKSWLDSKPNPGFVYTSNVDGHFQKAGFAEESIYECHGSIHYLQCCMPCNQRIWPIKTLQLTVDRHSMVAQGFLPFCPDCGGFARPNILMFDDAYWLEHRARQQQKRYLDWRLRAVHQQVVVIELGVGSAIGPIRWVGESFPGTLLRINPSESNAPKGSISLAMSALAALTAIERILSAGHGPQDRELYDR